MSTTLSPQQAADRVGTSRWTISRAIKSRHLHAEPNNRNHYRIKEADLDAWAADNIKAVVHTEQHSEQQQSSAHVFEIANARLETENEQLKERLAVRENDVNRLLMMIESMTQQKTIWGRIWNSRK